MSPRIGLALGSGSARGWAHIGVLRELNEQGIKPDIVCGSSIGAVVAAAYVSNQLDEFESWIYSLNWWDIVRLMNIRLRKGGFIEGERLMAFLRKYIDEITIEQLHLPFGAVATDLVTGREIWLREGLLADAVRASIALPGLFTPVKLGNRWVVDGGLVNPVPVSLCRALGADIVIAVNLNAEIPGRHFSHPQLKMSEAKKKSIDVSLLAKLFSHTPNGIKEKANSLISQSLGFNGEGPGLFDVLTNSINIMQHQITRSRMAGDPPNVVLVPHLADVGLLEFERAKESVTEGKECVKRMLPHLEHALQIHDYKVGA